MKYRGTNSNSAWWIACLFIVLSSSHVNAQLAKDKCKFLGNIIAGSVPSDWKNYWNQVTPENGGKWGSVESGRDVMNWTELDIAYNYAKNNDLPFKQHALVWGQQQPSWIGTLTPQEQLAEVEEWIKAFCERYPDTDYIDVVNEPLHAVPDYSGALGGTGISGWDWVVWAFEKAREYCPNAKLILNDYSIVNDDESTRRYIGIIKLLQKDGLIDIIGEQGHFLETTPSATIKNNLDRLYATGLPIHISEYDVNLSDDQAQDEKYQEQFPLLWSHPGVHGITLWGYKENQIWREDSYLVRSNGSLRPALTWLSDYVEASKGGTFCGPVTGMLEREDGMRVYPSPAHNGKFTIDLGAGNFEVSIVDTHGQVKKEFNVSGNEPVAVYLEEPAGLYFLRISDGAQTTCRKVLVN